MELVSVDHANGFVPVEQVKRHRNDGRVDFGDAATLRMPSHHRVIPVVVGMALRTGARDLIGTVESVQRVERNCGGLKRGCTHRAAMPSGRKRGELTSDRRQIGTYLIFGFSEARQTRKRNEREKGQKERSFSKCGHQHHLRLLGCVAGCKLCFVKRS